MDTSKFIERQENLEKILSDVEKKVNDILCDIIKFLKSDNLKNINPGIEGPYFDSRFSSTKKTLTAEMFQNGNRIDLLGSNPDDLQIKLFGEDETNINNRWFIYWFKEDVTIDASSEDGYSSYGGDGWRCLNDYKEIEDPISGSYEKQWTSKGVYRYIVTRDFKVVCTRQ